jgi:hypothetical protein
MGSLKERGNPSYNKGLPGTCRHAFALQVPKWLGTGARPFAITFELAQSKSLAEACNLFAGSQVVTHDRLRAFAPGF